MVIIIGVNALVFIYEYFGGINKINTHEKKYTIPTTIEFLSFL